MRFGQKKILPLRRTGVRLEDVREELAATRTGTVILGLGEIGPMTLDLDFSHVLIVGDTGSGASSVMRSFLAQSLAHGAAVVVLDRVRGTHDWANGHPDVRQARSLDEIAAELVAAREELERRQETAATDILTARRLVLAIEKRAGLVEALQERWMEIRRTGDPKKAPAVEALAALEWASPMLGIHLVTSTHSAAWMPADSLAPYNVRILSGRVGELAWPYFTGGRSRPLSAASGCRGEFWVQSGATTVPLRALYLTDEESRHLVAAVIAAARQSWGAA